MRILAGTSGYSYPAWRGRFYPPDLPAARMLEAYAQRFDAVEINATFHRMPSPRTLATWRARVPERFTFALKAPQRITHYMRLAGVDEPVRRLLEAAAELGPTLGPILFQLPPTLEPDPARLRALLALLPPGGRFAFEFRHPGWLEGPVLAALAEAGAALCVTDTEAGETPAVATAPFGYLRLRRAEYDEEALRRWHARIREKPWREAFVFFKHEDEARGPAFAERFARLGAEEAGAPPP